MPPGTELRRYKSARSRGARWLRFLLAALLLAVPPVIASTDPTGRSSAGWSPAAGPAGPEETGNPAERASSLPIPGRSGAEAGRRTGSDGRRSGAGPPPALALPPPSPADARAVPGEILAFSESLRQAQSLRRSLAAQGARVREQQVLRALGMVVIRFRLPPGSDARAWLARLRRAFPQADFDLNHRYRLQAADPRAYGRHLVRAGSPASDCGRGLRIGLLDSAVEASHPALAGQDIRQRLFVERGGVAAPRDHGTAMAALLVGRADAGPLAGLVPGATLWVAAVFETRQGRIDATVSGIVRGLDFLAGRKARILNLSLAGPGNRILRRAIVQLARQDRLLVAAAGNAGPLAPPRYPAAWPEVLSVTAVDARRRVYANAVRGAHLDLAAPGVDVWVARAGGGAFASGTSYAAPFVTALAARHWLQNPRLTAAGLRRILRDTALDLGTPGPDAVFGAGLVQAPAGICRDAGKGRNR